MAASYAMPPARRRVLFVDDAMELVRRAVPPLPMAARVRRLRVALTQYARWGLTEIHDASIELADINAYEAIGDSEISRITTCSMPSSAQGLRQRRAASDSNMPR